MKTVKFAEVVRRAGPPQLHVSWLPPAKDPELSRALKQHRVMTIHQQLRGSRKDFGTIGLDRGAAGQVLIFPKPLRRFAGRRVIAVDYSLLPRLPASPRSSPAALFAPKPQAQRPPPAAKSTGREQPLARKARERATTRGARRAASAAPARQTTRPASPRAGASSTPTTRRSAPPRSKASRTPAATKLLQVIRAAAADLKAGRAVPAYDRLQQVLEATDPE